MFRRFSISEIHSQMETGRLHPIDVAEECISRVKRFDRDYRPWVCFDPEALRRGADAVKERLASKQPLRSLEGIPLGIKDVFNTSDFPTEMGSEIWRGFTPGNDARVVYYLRMAGGLIAGKTVTAEFAVHALNETLNPHNVELTPGTSSSGSAVGVALGMVPVALGTQTGGSIIRPASFCGIYGFKPSFGLLPRTGSLKTTDSLDTIGFFVSHPSDLRRVLEASRVHGPNFPFSYSALKDDKRQSKPKERPWRVALVKTHTWRHAPDYAKDALLRFATKLDQHGVHIFERELPAEMEQAHQVHSVIYDKCLSYYFREEYKTQGRISEVMRNMIARGEQITGGQFHAALEMQNRLIAEMDRFLSDTDAIISLSTAGAAPKRHVLEELDPALMWTLTHLPAISVPAFQSPQGAPFGLQIAARKYNDHLLLNLIDDLWMSGLAPASPSPLLSFW
ncbi:glutamyl-tRNA amidotransferase subunit A [Methylosinus sp. C49]|uniref:amidase n=1 Tax=Methylosinus sp. C49 TaxID=2699395 RepID=UPI0013670B31|nr:amidase [Methylosinus sp. C49]BBU63721.1 glutamyl-tRNA amidotransferase subunit A [Methylosinus sp. C49]